MNGKFITGLLVGAVAGIACGLLLASKSRNKREVSDSSEGEEVDNLATDIADEISKRWTSIKAEAENIMKKGDQSQLS